MQRKLCHCFPYAVMAKGTSYHLNQAVRAIHVVGTIMWAEVVGSEIYLAGLNWTGAETSGEILVHCTCPHFSRGDLCKHLWALILEIDKKGLSYKIPIRRPLRLNRVEKFIFPKSVSTVQKRSRSTNSSILNWREAFNDNSRALLPKKSGKALRTFGLILKEDDHDHDSINFLMYASELTSAGVYSIPRLVPFPDRSVFDSEDSNFKAIVKTLAALALNDESSSWNRFGASRRPSDPYSRKIDTKNLTPLLESVLATGKIFPSSEAFGESLKGKSQTNYFFTRFEKLTFHVSESNAGGYLIEGQTEILLAADFEVREKIPLNKLIKFSEPNLCVFENKMGFLEPSEVENTWVQLLQAGSLSVPEEDVESFLEAALNEQIKFEFPESLQWPITLEKPQAKVQLVAEKRSEFVDRYIFDLKFQYGLRIVSHFSNLRRLVSGENKKIYERQEEEEAKVYGQLPLHLLNLRSKEGDEQRVLPVKNLIEFVREALKAGIAIEVENKKIQVENDFQVSVSSGVDWFDVDGEAQFSGIWVKFPIILEAIRRGESFVPLVDGSVGIINEDLKKKLEKLSAFAESSKNGLRFSQSQGLLLNSLLDDEVNLKLDEKFSKLREQIKTFSGLKQTDPVASFCGKLRKYQKEGLGWLQFLESFGFGGILADDMGLGKTIQCLAFLEGRRNGKNTDKNRKLEPSLLLAPKSLLSNWQLEAAKFTPKLKVLILSGTERERDLDEFRKYDLVVSTYQTMLRDLASMKEINWSCVILDEAQAIKNPKALISRAVKQIPATYKLAMTGTPIENSIQDLFSISDFVNPGFLRGKNRTANLKLSDDSREVLLRAFKPVILRRTKEQVLKDLPEKTEQIISVELESKQLRIYNELKKFYQSQLLKEVSDNGINKSKIQILAALTRLRQAALHPGLIDSALVKSKCAKFEIVLQMLEDIISEGHRVLIFSQFTGLLALLKTELDEKKIEYCYLDGQTKRRQDVINDFKTKSCPVFLLSLKAGGVGLNLVEADYVFLLDPWWNPAVEAQAIDRVHRIGQKQAVNAYRFIAKNTVEEKILELQQTKKGISSEILDEQSSLMKSLTAKDIENLFM